MPMQQDSPQEGTPVADGSAGAGQGAPRPGVYILIFALSEALVTTVGRLGPVAFPQGGYAYVGSGMGGVEARVRRHLREHTKPRWHLDYLLPLAEPAVAVIGYTREPAECALAGRLGSRFLTFTRFGSSDCRCQGHLFHSPELAPLTAAAQSAVEALGCPKRLLELSSLL